MKKPSTDRAAATQVLRLIADGLLAGRSLGEWLPVVQRNSHAAQRCPDLMQALLEAHRQGRPLASAAVRVPMLAPAQDLLTVAEARGALPQAFLLLAQDGHHRFAVRRRLWVGLAWPATLLVVLGLMALVYGIFVLPAFVDVFASFGGELPLPTRVATSMASAMATAGWLLPILAVYTATQVRKVRRTAAYPSWMGRLVRALPPLARVLHADTDLRLAQMMAVAAADAELLKAALGYLIQVAPLPPGEDRPRQLLLALQQGVALHAAVAQAAPSLGDFAVALQVHELDQLQPGAVVAGVQWVIDTLSAEAQHAHFRLERLTVLTTNLVVGLTVGFFVVALYLPIFKFGAVV